MTPDDVAFIKAAVTFLLLAGTGLGGYWLRLRARAESPERDPAFQALREDQARLQGEMEARLAEMEDRLDFAERRLLQALPLPMVEPPSVATPV